jgi:exopolysaccharide production protein ExoZ
MKRLVGLQWGRAIAAITVVITHAIIHPYKGSFEAAHLFGKFGVTLFFVISGYIMVRTTGTESFAPLDFIKKRLLRVAPLYYFATAVAVIGVLIVPWAFKDTVFDVRHIVMSVLFIPTPEPGGASIDPFLRLGWTLNFEMFFYAVFALLFAFNAMTRAVMLTVIFVTLMALGQLQIFPMTSQPMEFYTRIDTLGFVTGVWLAVLSMRYEWEMKTGQGIAWLAVSAVSLVGLIIVYPLAAPTNPWIHAWVVATCTVIIGVLAMAGDAWEPRVPNWAAYLGDASYSMYLFHMFAIGAVTVLVIKKSPAAWGPPLVIVSAVAGMLAGVFVYRFIEKPLNRMVKRAFDAVAGTLKPRLKSA